MAFRVLLAGVGVGLCVTGAAMAETGGDQADPISGLTRVDVLAQPQATIAGARVYGRDGGRLGDVEQVALTDDGVVLGVVVTPFVFGNAADTGSDEAPQAPDPDAPAPLPTATGVFALKAAQLHYDARTGIVMADAQRAALEAIPADTALTVFAEEPASDT